LIAVVARSAMINNRGGTEPKTTRSVHAKSATTGARDAGIPAVSGAGRRKHS